MLYIWLSFFSALIGSFTHTATLTARTSWHKKPTIEIGTEKIAAPSKPIITERVTDKRSAEKEWNFIIYIAGNNNLYSFIDSNLRQLMTIGSNDLINIIVQVDKFGTQEVTRSLVEKDGMNTYWKSSNFNLSERVAHPELYNSGALPNFIDFLQTAVQRFPAKHNAVIIWNHGAGSYDPTQWRQLMINPENQPLKGMAFNDNYNYYLSNQDLTDGLRTVCENALQGKPFAFLGLDICHGGQLEIASQAKKYINYMVASQETEIAYGWNYIRTLGRVSQEKRSELECVTDFITAYRDEYINFMPDYTLSVFDMTTKNPATDITYFEELENSLHIMSTSLINLLRSSQRNIIRSIVSDTRYKKTLCCDFYSGEYIDLHLFLLSLQAGLRQVLNLYDFRNQYPTIATHIQECMNACTRSIDLLYKVIPVYTCGVAFAGNPIRARGISIAFPSRVIHSSYAKTIFAKNNNWFVFLKEFLTTRDKENATAA